MQDMNVTKIPKRILNSLLSSMAAGVVPRMGARYIAIGRTAEIAAICKDLENVAEGGSATRFLIGKYGCGKSFLIRLMQGYAVEKGFVCAVADLSPERRLSSTNGGGLATYRELIRNLSTKASPDGGALPQMISKWLSDIQYTVTQTGIFPDSPGFEKEVSARIYAVLREIETGVGAFDFARVIETYYLAWKDDDEHLQSDCLRWLRGEFGTKTQARAALSVSGIINDENWYDYIKLLAAFSRRIGYGGLVIFIDECVNLYKIPNRVSRENNYEKILSVFNDTLQGKAPYIGFIFVGTPQFLEDTRRGLFSYEALRSRLADCSIVSTGFRNLAGPIIRLTRLTDSELYALMRRLNLIFSEYSGEETHITPEQMTDFLSLCLSRAGADTMVTPREIIRSYLTLLQLMKANPDVPFRELLSEESVSRLSAQATDFDGEATEEGEGSFAPDEFEL